ncbi:MAG: undecaprenyl/decaprenyl-phosphate alpha-N-acetylglucosaminyl 1-phosphate transferase [Chloroflexi bacterium]|nr:undecaprenyl/decaprenyl-phosphate alpha-N-acetylglucosaminyl 1-phosphate transferase [Chloroflexota bacterium]
MTTYMLIIVAALGLAAAATPLARRLAQRAGVLDQPSDRKIHAIPIPRLGGVAIFAAFILALVFLGDRFYVNQVVGIFLGATLVSFLGLWDDRRSLPAWVKLLGQIAAALILLLSGVQITVLRHPVLNGAATMLWVVVITNALNLLDNMDGLAGGVAAIAALFFLLLAAMSGQYLVGALAAALLGACIGFLVYNLNPATIFMGDSGALFIGFMLAAVGIKLRFPDNVPFVTWMIPVLVLGLPLFDTTLVTLSRLRRGKNPLTTPGQDHVSHRLAGLTGSRREAVLICYLIAGAAGVVAVFVTQATVIEGYVVGGLVLLAALAGLWKMEQMPFGG